ncbi:MAG: site-specific DNA-methyltransferase [Stygiobacter sp.]|uniref:Methyltransferase n=1 Tax=Stygiobacter electus TaxID=3032292 RepID=A0AAE3TCT1_9BACT|nr:site-specific DNA-methyltransferase [Stygiobacter electus]MDF1612255.1 site-specific DNA-methyltransferase [Stygiobacter electus]
MNKTKAKRNRTLIFTEKEKNIFSKKLITLSRKVEVTEIINKTINQDLFEVLEFLPESFVDLLFIDPPYNLNKNFKSNSFKEMKTKDYIEWIDSWISKLVKILKPTASIYICGDFRSSSAIQQVGEKYFKVRNRIVWERDKGRGAKSNWKNNTEDIWFFTMSNDYTFNLDAVKLKKKVIAPYRENGKPKDWEESENGNYRLTHPSNIWTDITIPFWSMPENTEHPTQKPEKLLAKIILASSNENDVIFDPFLGSGTTSVVAKKLNRNYVGIEMDKTFASIAEKRLELAESDKSIQGYFDGVFWERNSLMEQKKNLIK